MKNLEGNRVASIKKIVLDNFEPFQKELAQCAGHSNEFREAVEKRWDIEVILDKEGVSYKLPKKYEAVSVWGTKEEVENYSKNGCVLSGEELLVHINLAESWQSISGKLEKIYKEKSLGTIALKEKEITFEEIAKVFSDYYSFPDVELIEIIKSRVRKMPTTKISQLRNEFIEKVIKIEMLIDPYLRVLVRGQRHLIAIEETMKDIESSKKPYKPIEIKLPSRTGRS